MKTETVKTEFKCQLCDTNLSFDITNPATFTSKTPHQTFFGMQLSTYRVFHDSSSERHINSIIVDDKGFYRGHIDAYPELREHGQKAKEAHKTDYWPLSVNEEPIRNHSKIEIFLILSISDFWAYEIISPPNIKALDLTVLITEKIQEIQRIYVEVPSPVTIQIGNQEFHIWSQNSILIAVNFKDENTQKLFPIIAKQILINYQKSKVFPPIKKIQFILKVMDRQFELITHANRLLELLYSDLFHSKITIKYPEQISKLSARIKKKFPIAPRILDFLFRGEKSLIELLETENLLDDFYEIIELINYMNRRKIVEA